MVNISGDVPVLGVCFISSIFYLSASSIVSGGMCLEGSQMERRKEVK